MKAGLFTAAACLALIAAPAGAQDEEQYAEQMAERFETPPDGWVMPRTDWGDPDLRGTWPVDYLGRTPRERNPAMGTRAFLTNEEYNAAFAAVDAQLQRYDEENEADMMAMGHWTEFGHPLRQSSMIVEPANGRYPALTELGTQLRANERTSWNTYVFDTMDDFGIFDRCLTRGMPGSMLPGAYNGGIEIFQSPGLVAISLEMIHETRMVYLDGRDHPPANMQYDLGYSIGHWEGDSLVIDTRNFRPGMSMGPAPNSEQLHVQERLTLMNDNQIHYEVWVRDPLVMEDHYKIDVPWLREPGYGMYEYACHEGNVQIRGYITATSPRFADERAETWAAQGRENHESAPVR